MKNIYLVGSLFSTFFIDPSTLRQAQGRILSLSTSLGMVQVVVSPSEMGDRGLSHNSPKWALLRNIRFFLDKGNFRKSLNDLKMTIIGQPHSDLFI